MNMTAKISSVAAAGLLAASLATSVSAETINFSDYSDANGEGFFSDIAPAGIAVNSNVTLTTGASGWLDGSNLLGNPSGLGSCLDAAGCDGAPTDDVDPGADLLTINFSDTVTITDMLIRDDFHLVFDGEIDVNGTVLTVVGGAISGLSLSGTSFDFTWVSGVDSGDVQGFYVEAITAAVPLPAGMLLLGTALGGLGLARRKKKAA